MIQKLNRSKVVISGLISSKEDPEVMISELETLIRNKGGEVVGKLIQRRGVSRSSKPGGSAKLDQPLHSSTFISQGKSEALTELCQKANCDLIVFLNDLNKHQVETLSNLTGCEVISKSSLG